MDMRSLAASATAICLVCMSARIATAADALPYMAVAGRLGWQPSFDMQMLERLTSKEGSADLWVQVRTTVEHARELEASERLTLQGKLEATNATGLRRGLVSDYLTASYQRARRLYQSLDELLTPEDRAKVISSAAAESFNVYDPFCQEFLGLSDEAMKSASGLIHRHANLFMDEIERRERIRPEPDREARQLADLRLKWEAMSDFLGLLTPEQQRLFLSCTLNVARDHTKSQLNSLLSAQLKRRLPNVAEAEREKLVGVLLKNVKEEAPSSGNVQKQPPR